MARSSSWLGARSEACSSSRLARTLVSGVRSSCEASATNSRCFFIAASRSVRAASSERSICSSVRASSPTSSLDLGVGHVAGGVAGAGDLARGRGQRRDRPHRPAGDRDAGEAGEQGAAEDAGGDEEPEAVDGRVDVGDVAAVLDEPGGGAGFAADAGGRDPHLAVVGEAERGGRPQRLGAGAFLDQVAFGVEDPRRGAVGADEVVEFGPAVERRRAAVLKTRLSAASVCAAPLTWRLKSSRMRLVATWPITAPKTSRIDQGEAGRDRRQAPAHRPAARARNGARPPRRAGLRAASLASSTP